ncbi:cache domain-containing protein [[Phormidium] sp. ETS-05]|uniref:cache domain-containing protein n=1 Tax=[Phormidium] sp. ETS-05 TaxID=222819 RepID=UPI001E58F4CD|nr:cache domain-containing protein [[Phormidium] sp. ETS-05]
MTNVNLPLRLVLVVPFVLQIGAAVGLTGWISFRNGEKAVNDLASQLRGEISARIHQEIGNYLQAPRTIAQVNANAISLGQLNLADPASLTRQFWLQRDLLYPVIVSAIYFGGADGKFSGLGFQNDNTWQISDVGPSTGGKFHSYRVAGEGFRGELISIGGDYDPRIRPWYGNAVAAGKPSWSDIYVDFKDPRLKVTLVQPIYREDGELRGFWGGFCFVSYSPIPHESENREIGTDFYCGAFWVVGG